MKISILSYYSGINLRGVESWASSLVSHSQEKIKIIDGWDSYNPFRWQGDIVVPTNGRLQVLLTRLVSKKVVVFGHSGPGADDKWNLWCCPNVFVAFSTPQAVWANKFKLPWTKVVIIPHAVDIKMFAPDPKIRKAIDVLCVASNDPNKRINLITRAVSLLPGVKFVAVGRGNPVQADWKDMPKIYQQAKVFCFVPWQREAFGLVYLEAMACNLPVVATDDPVRREIVGNAGILVKNTDDLSQSIRTALNKKWGTKPRMQAIKFSWDNISGLYTKLWQSL